MDSSKYTQRVITNPPVNQVRSLSRARNHGISFTIAPDIALIDGIDAARNLLNRCWFDEEKCCSGIKPLESYKKEWNDR